MTFQLKREALLKPNETARKVQKINKLVKTYKPVSNHASNIAHAKKMKVYSIDAFTTPISLIRTSMSSCLTVMVATRFFQKLKISTSINYEKELKRGNFIKNNF